MRAFLVLLTIGGISLGAPKIPPPPNIEAGPTKEEIIATLRHMRALVQEQTEELDKAKTEADTLGKLHTAALADLNTAASETVKVQKSLDTERQGRIDAEKERDEEREAKEAFKLRAEKAEHHLSSLKTSLTMALGIALVLLVNKLPFGLIMPPGSIYARVAASAFALGAAWFIVARLA